VVDAAEAERGYGVFVLPSPPQGSPCPIHTRLSRCCLLHFSFTAPDPCVAGASSRWVGFFVSFAYKGKVKRKRPEHKFCLSRIDNVRVPRKISLLPFCPARVSPLEVRPDAAADLTKPCKALSICDEKIPRPESVEIWNVDYFDILASTYPFPDVAQLAMDAIRPGGSPSTFVGDRSKCVLCKNSPLSAIDMSRIRAKFSDEISKGRMKGPFQSCPFPNDWCPSQPRNVPLSVTPKDKWILLSDRIRVIANLSKFTPHSVNDLVFSPKFISFHLQGHHLRDLLALSGPNPQFSAIDQQEAFRSEQLDHKDLHSVCLFSWP